MQQPSQPSSYSLQDQQHRRQQFMSSPGRGTHSPNPHSSTHQSSDQPFQGTRKRGLYSDPEETSTAKKRHTGSESEGLFGWGDLLAATTHSPGTTSSRFPVEIRQGYFDQHSSYQSNPATPPMDPAVSPSVSHFTRFQPSGYQQSPPRSGWGESEHGEGQDQLNYIGATFARGRMDVEILSQGGTYHGQMTTFRSISPAPSSPSGSIDGSEATSMVGHISPDEEERLANRSAAPLVQDKKASGGRAHFVMGFRPGCERCQRREKGHFAHFS
ncbi:hypothetical protein EC991_005801 [Linnemannia zychae]|nr:hypothetical protein EC991_005801 [Linnemannia zychae]